LSDDGDATINLTFNVAPETFADLVTRETIENRAVVILKVKKPDFLGESMWEFKFENRTIPVKFEDASWLKKFRERTVVLRPGDAIKAWVRTEIRYSFEGEVIETVHTLEQVLEVISIDPSVQSGLF
jgi:hypothetical protein